MDNFSTVTYATVAKMRKDGFELNFVHGANYGIANTSWKSFIMIEVPIHFEVIVGCAWRRDFALVSSKIDFPYFVCSHIATIWKCYRNSTMKTSHWQSTSSKLIERYLRHHISAPRQCIGFQMVCREQIPWHNHSLCKY